MTASTSNKTTLDNGIRIVTESLPSRTVSVGIWVDAGSRDEDVLSSGVAHFVEHMLFKGTASRSPDQVARELDGLGGASNAFTSKDATCFYATVLDSHLAELLGIYSDLFLHSQFADIEVERERSVILQEIDSVEDTPEDVIHDLFSSLIWAGHPLSNPVLGQRNLVFSFSSEKLREFVRQHYSPDKIIIAAAGNVQHEAFVSLLEKEFSQLKSPANVPGKKTLQRTTPKKHLAKKVMYHRALEQEHIVLGAYGLAADSPKRYAMALLNVLLGGNMSSRLFQEVREKRGLAYSIFSFAESNSDCGQICIYTGVNPKNSNAALAIIEEIVNTIACGTISQDELLRAQGYARASMYLGAENMDARMLRLVKNELIHQRQISFAEVDDELAAVTVSEVNLLAEELFHEPLNGIFLGPQSEKEIVHG